MIYVEPTDPQMRTDKWQLATGGTSYAPEHPLHLHVPGFWDEVRIGRRKYSKLLCASFVLEDDRGGGAPPPPAQPDERSGGRQGGPHTELIELDPYLSYWHWYPDRIEARYYLVVREGIGYKQQAGVRVFLDEKRYIAADGTLHCEFSFDLLKQHPPHLQVVAWGVDAKLRSPAGPKPVSTGKTAASGHMVPKLAHTPYMIMLRSGRLSSKRTAGKHTLSALHWNVSLAADDPVTLHVTSAPA